MSKDWWAEPQQQQGKEHSEENPVSSCLSSITTTAAPGDSILFPTASFFALSPPHWSPQAAPVNNGHGGGCVSQPSPPSSPVSATSAGASSNYGSGRRVVMQMRRVEGKYVVVGNSKYGSAMVCGSIGLRRRSKAILEYLRERGCTSEVRIRAAVGDSPDTSKALRMLLKLDQVKRTGGRPDPFLYRIAGPDGGRTPRTTAQLGTGAPVLPL